MQIRVDSTVRADNWLFAFLVVIAGALGCHSDSGRATAKAAEDATEQSPEEVEPALQVEPYLPRVLREPPVIPLVPIQGVMGTRVDYYRPGRIPLTPEPQELLVAEPDYQSPNPLYGAMRVGHGENDIVTLVVDEIDGATSKIYIDRDNDEDLTNDGTGDWQRISDSTLGLPRVLIYVKYPNETVPYFFGFYRFKTRLRDVVLYYRDSWREGDITSGGKTYAFAVLDENADGRFDDLENGTLIIDLNQDGKLDGSSKSAELHKLNEPFNIHGKVWKVASLPSSGTLIEIRPSEASVEMHRYLDLGCPAPEFVAKGLDEEIVELAPNKEGVHTRCSISGQPGVDHVAESTRTFVDCMPATRIMVFRCWESI